jgi:ribosomal protein S18 acetylase RimI-like enzyme
MSGAVDDRLRIRPATLDDAAFVLGLVPRFAEFELPGDRRSEELVDEFGRSLREALAAGADVFVAEDADGTPVGFIHLQTATDLTGRPRAHVGDLAVTQDAQGRGAGRALMRFAEQWAAERGHDRIGLVALTTNERALRFYERLGYERDTVTLVKPLPPR